MASDLTTLDVRTRADWRRWLAEHHASSPGIWLLRHKQHTGAESMSYEDLVCEALCHGWIDSLVKRVDDNRYAIKVTPRKPTSKWSEINRKRWQRLAAAGLLAAPGLAACPTEKSYAPRPQIPEMFEYFGPYENVILSVRPGIFSLPKVWLRDQLPLHETVLLDSYYVLRRTLLLDLRIIARGIYTVVLRRGVYS